MANYLTIVNTKLKQLIWMKVMAIVTKITVVRGLITNHAARPYQSLEKNKGREGR
jgi:hypothetical protein